MRLGGCDEVCMLFRDTEGIRKLVGSWLFKKMGCNGDEIEEKACWSKAVGCDRPVGRKMLKKWGVIGPLVARKMAAQEVGCNVQEVGCNRPVGRKTVLKACWSEDGVKGLLVGRWC